MGLSSSWLKSLHNAALEAKIKKADEDYKKALTANLVVTGQLAAAHGVLPLATATLAAANALPVTGTGFDKMVASGAKAAKIGAATVQVMSAKAKLQAAKS